MNFFQLYFNKDGKNDVCIKQKVKHKRFPIILVMLIEILSAKY
jgi:hypothetical protein